MFNLLKKVEGTNSRWAGGYSIWSTHKSNLYVFTLRTSDVQGNIPWFSIMTRKSNLNKSSFHCKQLGCSREQTLIFHYNDSEIWTIKRLYDFQKYLRQEFHKIVIAKLIKKINPSKKGTQIIVHSFVIYMSFLEKFLSYNLTLSLKQGLAEIHDDLTENMRFQKLHFYNTTQIDTTMRYNGQIGSLKVWMSRSNFE